jgi:spore germination protein GerM
MRVFQVIGMAMLVTLVGLVAAGCGDDDDDDATPTPGADEVEVVLYFPKPTDTDFEFIAVERTVASDESDPESIVALLLAGPLPGEESEHGVSNPFPADVSVLSIEVEGDTATVDLSQEVLDYGGGSANVISISESIVRTVSDATGAANVVILVEGEPDKLQP